MAFSGSAGTLRSQAGNIVAGYGSSIVHNQKTLTASMTPTAGTPIWTHTYVFTIVSITFNRAVSRTKDFLSVFRTQ